MVLLVSRLLTSCASCLVNCVNVIDQAIGNTSPAQSVEVIGEGGGFRGGESGGARTWGMEYQINDQAMNEPYPRAEWKCEGRD